MSPFVALPPAIAPLPAHAKPAVVVRRAHSAPYGWQILTVRSGDTLSDIAIAHRSTVGALIARNRIRDGGDFLAIGRHLWVPRTTPAHVPAPPPRHGPRPMSCARATPSAASPPTTR